MTYMVKSFSPMMSETELLTAVKLRSGDDTVTQEWIDMILPEVFAYMIAMPAKCKAGEWLTWDDLPQTVQAILVGTISRQLLTGTTNIVLESIGDYEVKYSDPALFEGKIPRFFNDGEELAISRLAGCGGTLRTINVQGMPIIDTSEPEKLNTPKRVPLT